MDIKEFGVKIVSVFDKSSFSKAKQEIKKETESLSNIAKFKISFDEAKTSGKINFVDKIGDSYKSLSDTISQYYRGLVDLSDEEFTNVVEQRNRLSLLYNKGITEKQKSEIEKLGQVAGYTANRLQSLGEKVKEAFNINGALKKVKNSLEGIGKKVFKWGIALLGIRDLWTGIRRAMNSYLTQNEELNDKLNGAFYALGSLFAPAIEYVVNLFVKLIGYVDVFARALGFAGINMSKLNAKSEKTQKSLAGFDEINNIATASGSSTTSNPFEGLELNAEWVKKIQALAEKLSPILEVIKQKLKEIFEWIGDHIPLVITVIGALFTLVAVSKISTFFQTITKGIAAVKGLGIVSIITGAVMAVSAFINMWKNGWNIVSEIIKDLGIALVAVGAIILGAPAVITVAIASAVAAVTYLAIVVKDNWTEIKTFTLNVWNAIKNGVTNAWTTMKTGISTAVNNIKTTVVNVFNSVKTSVSNIWNSIWTTVRGVINKIISGIETMCNAIARGINAVLTPLTRVGNSILRAVGITGFSFSPLSTVSLPRLATGTNYVPNDMVAQLHQGEAVVPKEFNSKEFFGNSDETNGLLRQLIDIVDTKEFKTYISQKDIGKAAVNYINNQSRVMGGSLV